MRRKRENEFSKCVILYAQFDIFPSTLTAVGGFTLLCSVQDDDCDFSFLARNRIRCHDH